MLHPLTYFLYFWKLISGGVDFTPVSRIIYFPPGSVPGDQICASIAITDDTLQEQSESFYVHVFISDTAVAVTNDLATVIIVDNDSKCIRCTAYNIIMYCKHRNYNTLSLLNFLNFN